MRRLFRLLRSNRLATIFWEICLGMVAFLFIFLAWMSQFTEEYWLMGPLFEGNPTAAIILYYIAAIAFIVVVVGGPILFTIMWKKGVFKEEAKPATKENVDQLETTLLNKLDKLDTLDAILEELKALRRDIQKGQEKEEEEHDGE